DIAVLGLRGTPRPGREENVRRSDAAKGCSDGFTVLEVGRDGSDARVEIPRVAAESRDLPAVSQQTSRDVASADAGDADHKRVSSAHERWPGTGMPLRRTWL